ncbi:acyl carrier protein [Rhodococcoides kyotonense]|uniref:Act minimal PKS acyl carrier protein n=1 Tax=Rhodococcoides kyotonense TaxID=398843 RepID=A0A239MDQ6_9NOCA|nr:acyl carrier protein [Rhodococcus kyotonensis]SNT40078.1 act minimal PKS acyl carrier protein [Rhodococcus kyotonensis]
MAEFGLQELKVELQRAAGEDEAVDLDGDILETSFEDLGYDSLALLEVVGSISRGHGITIADDLFIEVETPRQFIDLVNTSIAAQQAAAV